MRLRLHVCDGQRLSHCHSAEWPILVDHSDRRVNAEMVECSPSGYVRINSEGASATQLNYTATGIAVTMNGRGDTLLGCGLRLGSSAAGGVLMGGYSDHANQITVKGVGEKRRLFTSPAGIRRTHTWMIRGW